MCYLAHQQHAQAQRGVATPPVPLQRWRPRVAGAVATALIGGLALAALVVPAPTQPGVQAREPASMDLVAARPAGGSERSVIQADDGVPSLPQGLAAGRDCHHGL